MTLKRHSRCSVLTMSLACTDSGLLTDFERYINGIQMVKVSVDIHSGSNITHKNKPVIIFGD